MKHPLVTLIPFPSHNTKNGILTMIEYGKKPTNIPFLVKRTLVIHGMQNTDQRGGHTHHKTHQILFCLSGACSVTLDDGYQKKTVRLNKPNVGLYLKPYLWHTMQRFSPGTTLLVLTNTQYNEKDYIRKYDDFLGFVKKI